MKKQTMGYTHCWEKMRNHDLEYKGLLQYP